jgi:predicted transcriptional regulator of viral defense system
MLEKLPSAIYFVLFVCHNVDIYINVHTISHMAPISDRERLLRLARKHQILTTRGVVREGIHRQALTRLMSEGAIERIGRGRYRLPGQAITEHHGLALAAAAVPRGVVCLISALSFHGIGTQLPHQIWIAIDRRARRPQLRYPPLRVVRFVGKALTEGIETVAVEGQSVQVYCVEKTLADLFKYRNKVGLDVTLEALRDAWRARRFTMEKIDHFARICRVEAVMRPYLEALVA